MISVCMATYNGERFIKEQLSSILRQIEVTDEVIISDDGSTDSTLQIINSFDDDRVKVYQNQRSRKDSRYKFHNVTLNFENAIEKANGDFVYLADQDDIWLDGKVQRCQAALQIHNLVLSDCKIIDENNQILNESYFKWNNSKPGIFRNAIYKNAYLGCCMAFKRDLIKQILPMSNNLVPHDIWIGLLAEHYGKVSFESLPLVAYRRHGYNASPSGQKSTNGLVFKLHYRAELLISFIKRIYL